MRSVYLQNSKNQSLNIATQVQELNSIVLVFCVKEIYALLEQQMMYLKEINGPRQIMDHSVNMSSAGSKQLMPNHFV